MLAGVSPGAKATTTAVPAATRLRCQNFQYQNFGTLAKKPRQHPQSFLGRATVCIARSSRSDFETPRQTPFKGYSIPLSTGATKSRPASLKDFPKHSKEAMTAVPMKVLLAGVFLLANAWHITAGNEQQQKKHLQCWHCSSDTIGAEDFCDVTFQEDNIPTDLIKERNINLLRSCNSTINSDHERAVCRKTVEENNGKYVTKRFCYYTNKSDPVELCNITSPEKNVRRIFCEDCLTDRCNGAFAGASIWEMLLLLPILALIQQLAI